MAGAIEEASALLRSKTNFRKGGGAGNYFRGDTTLLLWIRLTWVQALGAIGGIISSLCLMI